MISLGILGPDDHVELLDGEIIEMSPIGPPHCGTVDWFNHRLVLAVGDRAVVRVRHSLRLSDRSMPEPDFVLARPRAGGYRTAHPAPDDTLLVIEVAESSLARDRDVKLPLYAEAGIPEVWIVDVAGKRILVYRQPLGESYQVSATRRPGDFVEVAALPDIRLAVDDVFHG